MANDHFKWTRGPCEKLPEPEQAAAVRFRCAFCDCQLPRRQLERLSFDRVSILLCPICGEFALGALAVACDEITRAAPFLPQRPSL